MREHKHDWVYDHGNVRCRTCNAEGTVEQLLAQVDALDRALAGQDLQPRGPDEELRRAALDHRGLP